jgi:hypothetical protein
MLTKYASLGEAEVLEVKGSQERLKTASLDKVSDYGDYRTDDGYMYARIFAISSRVNKNNDGWPSVELVGGEDAWNDITGGKKSSIGPITAGADSKYKYGFSTFVGKPHFVDHHNSDPKRARGVVVDSKIHIDDTKTAALDPYYSSEDADPEHLPPTKVELLIEVDAKAFPKLAKAIKNGDIDGFSMGCDVEKSKCSHCGNFASSPQEYCSHIVSKGAMHDMEVTSSDGSKKKVARKSYENCYGIKFFEISAVFDPADETALAQEVIHEANHREAAELPGQIGVPQPDLDAVMALAQELQARGIAPAEALDLAERRLRGESDNINYVPVRGGDTPPIGGGQTILHEYGPKFNIPFGYEPRQGSYLSSKRASDNPLPQFMHTKAPDEVDTTRETKVCPVCGQIDMEGEKCDVCGYVEEPKGFDNPDLSGARQDLGAPDPDEAPNMAQDNLLEGAPSPGTSDAVSYLEAKKTGRPPSVSNRIAGKINVTETPLKPSTKPATDEPKETVISDQTQPVTSAYRTAMDLIRAAKQSKETNMDYSKKVAAEPADPSGKAQKQVDVTGIGGVIDATNEQASKPDGAHSWENAGKQVDVTGKGGVIEDSNAEAAKPSEGTENLPTAGEGSNDAGFNKDKTTDNSGPTKTFDNSNEPNSAVSDKAFPTAAKKGTDPVDPVGKADERVDVEEPVKYANPNGTVDQWTGTGGNGVTRQQDPVTRKPFSHIVTAMKVADAEVELGLTEKDKKYDRVAELEALSPEELAAEERVVSRVKTAGFSRRAAATKPGEVAGRVPSFQRTAGQLEPKEAQKVDDTLTDAALFIR